MPDADLLADAAGLMSDHGIARAIIERIISELRQRYGGDTIYIQQIDRAARDAIIRAQLQHGQSIRQTAAKVQCSPHTVRRVRREEWTL